LITPEAPDIIFYATEAEYIGLLRVYKSKDSRLVVLAAPFEKNALDSSFDTSINLSNSPPTIDVLGRVKDFLPPLLPFRRWIKENKEGTLLELNVNNVKTVVQKYGQLISFWALGRVPNKLEIQALDEFSSNLEDYLRKEGYLRTCKCLKAALVYLGHFLSGKPARDPFLLGIGIGLSNKGLPRLFPNQWRREIHQGNLPFIRFVISILSFYRGTVGDERAPVSLETVVDDDPDRVSDSEIETILDEGLKQYKLNHDRYFKKVIEDHSERCRGGYFFQKYFKFDPEEDRLKKNPSIFPVWSSSANGRPGIGSLAKDLAFMAKGGSAYIKSYLALFGTDLKSWIFDRLTPETQSEFLSYLKTVPNNDYSQRLETGKVKRDKDSAFGGSLSIKVEPAGKMRVFAIVDCITQWALAPVHDRLFSVLKTLPGDGTFDHHAAAVRISGLEGSYRLSLDLKSATDRMPVGLYVYVLDKIFGVGFGKAWKKVLARQFEIPRGYDIKDFQNHSGDRFVRYSIGQPMGMLSSWAGLAIVHHYLVWTAAQRCGWDFDTFEDYAIIGDDVVISNPVVGEAYKTLLSELRVPFSIPKSFESDKGFFEFASEIWLDGDNLSPVQLKEVLMSSDMSRRANLVNRLATRWYGPGISLSRFLSLGMSPSDWKRHSGEFLIGRMVTPFMRVLAGFLLYPSKQWTALLWDTPRYEGVSLYRRTEVAVDLWYSAITGYHNPFSLAHNHDYLESEKRLIPKRSSSPDEWKMLDSFFLGMSTYISEAAEQYYSSLRTRAEKLAKRADGVPHWYTLSQKIYFELFTTTLFVVRSEMNRLLQGYDYFNFKIKKSTEPIYASNRDHPSREGEVRTEKYLDRLPDKDPIDDCIKSRGLYPVLANPSESMIPGVTRVRQFQSDLMEGRSQIYDLSTMFSFFSDICGKIPTLFDPYVSSCWEIDEKSSDELKSTALWIRALDKALTSLRGTTPTWLLAIRGVTNVRRELTKLTAAKALRLSAIRLFYKHRKALAKTDQSLTLVERFESAGIKFPFASSTPQRHPDLEEFQARLAKSEGRFMRRHFDKPLKLGFPPVLYTVYLEKDSQGKRVARIRVLRKSHRRKTRRSQARS